MANDREHEVQIRLELPRWLRMSSAKDFSGFWHSLSNDEVFECEQIFGEVTGRTLQVMRGRPEDWPEFRQVILACGRAVAVMNYAFNLLGVTYRDQGVSQGFTHLEDLDAWVERGIATSADKAMMVVLRRIAQKLSQAQWLGDVDYPKPLKIRELFRLHFVTLHEAYLPKGAFDIFISYKTRKYSSQAKTLRDHLARKGFSCWLDREQIPQSQGEWLDAHSLKAYLKAALEACRLTAFFETYGTATADEDFRGSHTAFNWQVFEARHARKLVYIRPPNRVIDFGDGSPSRKFTDEQDLAKQIADIYRGMPEGQSSESDEVADPSDGSRKELLAAVQELQTSLDRHFGRQIRLSARMALILLAPGGVDETNIRSIALGDDVLVNLVRYSPFAAGILRAAGVDIEKFLAVGVKFTAMHWSPPGNFRAADLFAESSAARIQRSRQFMESGVLDEAELLAGIMGLARENSYPRDLIVKTIRYMQLPDQEQAIEQVMNGVEARVADVVRNGLSPSPSQLWVLFSGRNWIRFFPFSECGGCRITELQPPDDFYTIHATLAHGIFDARRLSRIEGALEQGSPALEDVISRYPCLEFALEDIDRLWPARILFPGTDDGSFRGVFLTPVADSSPPCILRSQRPKVEQSSGDFLKLARSLLAPRAWQEISGTGVPAGNFQLSQWQCRPAIILGASMQPRGAYREGTPAMSSFDLQCGVLAELREMLELSGLDYDSF